MRRRWIRVPNRVAERLRATYDVARTYLFQATQTGERAFRYNVGSPGPVDNKQPALDRREYRCALVSRKEKAESTLSNPGDIRGARPRRAIRSPGLLEVPTMLRSVNRHVVLAPIGAAHDAGIVGWASVRMARRFTGVTFNGTAVP